LPAAAAERHPGDHHRRAAGGHLAVAGAVGLEWAGFYSYDLLDTLGRPSARQILPRFQQLAVDDWVPMGGKATPYTACKVARLEPYKLMLWRKGGGTWLWLLEPGGAGNTRLRSSYAWTRPTIVTELILMEIGDPSRCANACWASSSGPNSSRPDGGSRGDRKL
jgi:hypothetical protein